MERGSIRSRTSPSPQSRFFPASPASSTHESASRLPTSSTRGHRDYGDSLVNPFLESRREHRIVNSRNWLLELRHGAMRCAKIKIYDSNSQAVVSPNCHRFVETD